MNRFLLILGALLALPVAAMAQDTVISNAPFVDLFMPFLQAIALAMAPIVAGYIIRILGIKADDSKRAAFQTSLANAAGLLLAKAGSAARTATLDVRNANMAEAIRYVQNSAPDAIAKWGITPESIAQKIVAKIPQIESPSVDTLR